VNLSYTLSATVAIVALAGLGVFVFERERRRRANQLLGGFLLAVAGFLLSNLAYAWLRSISLNPIANLDIYDPRTWMRLANSLAILFASLFPSLLLHFAMEFPRPKWLARTRSMPLVYLPGLILIPPLLTSPAPLLPYRQVYPASPIFVIWQIWMLLYLATSLAALGVSYRAASSRIERQQLVLMLVGLGVPLVALPLGWQIRGWGETGWSNATWIFMAAMLSYGIARYQLLDIRVVVRRALIYSLLTAVVTVFYLGVVLAVNLLSVGLSPPIARLVNAALVVVIAVLLAPTKERVQNAVDRVFFRGAVGRQELLQRLSRELLSALTLDELADLLLQRLSQTLDAPIACLLLEQGGEFGVVAHRGEVPAIALQQRFRRGDDLIRSLGHYQRGITVEQMSVDPAFGATYVRSWARLDAMQATLCLPLLSGEETLMGCVFLGKRASGKAYGSDDIRFAQSMCNQAAIALENARLHQQASESERLAALGRMASAIVHDLRGPIGGMMKSVEALGQEELPLDVRDRLTRGSLEMMERLYRMAQQVLDYARGDWTLNMRAVGARDFIERLLPVLEMDLQEYGIQLVLDITHDGDVWMDPDRISQVLYNLVSNARDAMPNGGALTIGVHEENGEVQMVVADEGGGIPQERLARIFEPFVSYKGDRGAGLGLAICRKIVEDHHGNIRVSSQVGVGSTFVVTLPRRPQTPDEAQSRSTQP